MRELRPLNLPKLVAERNGASQSSEDLTVKTTACAHASAGSFSSISDVSGPPTPTFSIRGHSRFPSTSSSFTSNATSPVCEHTEILGSSSKLPMPQLPEEPAENEEDFSVKDEIYVDPFDSYPLDEEDRNTILLRASNNFDAYAFDAFSEPRPSRALRRQRSMDTTFNALSMRLNSIASKFSTRRNPSMPAGLGIQTTNLPSRPASSRSSSFTSAYFPGFDQNDVMPPTPAMSVVCNSMPVSPTDEAHPLRIGEPFDRRALSSTPLLPPMMNAAEEKVVEPVQSPLQSPTVADPNKTLSMVSSIAEPPRMSSLPSPPLSMKASVASFRRGRTSTLASVTDVPPLHVEEQTDEWSNRLGHANFFIEPAPYVPDSCDASACRLFIADWDAARQNYFKHRARVAEHYGAGSKTYKLTEEKWRSIDALWKEYSATASELCGQNSPITYSEPAPLSNMPTLSDPRCDGKFPVLGDKEIVGAMEVAPPLPQTSPPSPSGKIQAFFQSMFGRSRSATR